MRNLSYTLMLTGLLLAGAWQPSIAGDASLVEHRYRVLTLNTSDPYLPAFLGLDAAARAAITARLGSQVEFFVESLDMLRFPRSQDEVDSIARLLERYRQIPIDVVIAAGPGAWDFAHKHRSLWPDASIVFEGTTREGIDLSALREQDGGVLLDYDARGTLELALRLLPETRHVVLVAGNSKDDRWFMDYAQRALQPWSDRLEFTYLTDRSIALVAAEVGQLPAGSIVFFLNMFLDSTGVPNVPRPEIGTIAAASSVPVFSMIDTHIGAGGIAGSIVPWSDQGTRVGELVVDLLQDKRLATREPPAAPPARCIADWRELQRWNIKADRLPPGCEVRFRPQSIWEQHRRQAMAALAIILAQGLLIAGLLLQRRRRRLAEAALARQREELTHAARLATVGELTAAITHEINQPLAAILANVSSAELLVGSGKAGNAELLQVLADVRRDDLRASQVIKRLRALLVTHEEVREPVDVNAVTEEALLLVDAEAQRRQVVLTRAFAGMLPLVSGDRVQLQQVILNLVMNAMEAVSLVEPDRRKVEIFTRRNEAGVQVSVVDQGTGISAENAARLFESFYTTKRQGMGLGLSIAFSIVDAHGGRLWADSGRATGAAFHFTLPAA
jgi:signal transduction histidine kinase